LKLKALQRQSYTHYFYEATVGAGLPIVSTLRGLLETGDKILPIEGIFRFAISYYYFYLFILICDKVLWYHLIHVVDFT
jgi:aspartokinase/homoserine dehydrogenase 1